MSDQTQTSSSNTGLAFILGGVVVALGVVAWFVFGGQSIGDKPDIRIELPNGKAIEGDVKG